MPIKKIIISGLTNSSPTGSHFTGIGEIRFYDGDDELINSGSSVTSDTGTLFETNVMKVVPSSSYDNAYRVSRAFDTSVTSEPYWIANADNQTLTVDFKSEITNISKITFKPVPFTNRLVDSPFTITAYDENNVIYEVYTVTPITTLGDVQTLNTPKFRDVSNKILLLQNEKDYSLEYKEGKKENPIMTSNTSPFGEVSASSFSSGYEAWKAFDGNKTNATGAFGWQTNNLSYGWIQYKFNKKTEIYEYVIYCTITNTANTLLRMPKDWTFEGSNDGSSWTVLDTQINQTSWTSNESRKFTFSNYGSFIYYRLNISANNSPTNTYTSVGELELISPTTNKLISIPNHSSNNFIEYGIDSPVQVDGIFTNKNYILSTIDSDNGDGILMTKINRKPLSIKFN